MPLPRDSWLLGDTSPENTEDEEAYVSGLLDLCGREQVDVVFPSREADLFLLAKNAAMFASRGITLVAPPFDTLVAATDKHAVIAAAERAGLPSPRSFLCKGDEDVAAAIGELGYPLVAKARFSASSEWVKVITKPPELEWQVARLRLLGRSVILQEFVPGGSERSLHLLLSRTGRILLGFTLRKLHYVAPSYSTAIQVMESPPETEAAVRLLRGLGVNGFAVLQTKVDARNGRHTLIEINLRFGNNSRILFPMLERVGLNLPVLCLDIAQGIEPAEKEIPLGLLGVSPFEDSFMLLEYLRRRWRSGWSSNEPSNPLPSIPQIWSSYLALYARRPAVDDYWRALRSDPLVALAYYWGFLRTRLHRLRGAPPMIPWGDIDPW